MNQGAGAGRDDDDLPLVGVVVPDDARELFRDVLAYHRELRALRHRERWRKLLAPIRRGGPILPLACGILLFALISGVVLSVLSSGPYFSGGTTNSVTGAVVPGVTRLPADAISADGQPVPLHALTGVALTLVPAGCDCQGQLLRLITQARQAHVLLYLIAPGGQPAELSDLSKLASDAGQGQVIAADDPANGLAKAFHPIGLTALLVNAKGIVAVQQLRGSFALEPALAALRTST